MRFFCEVCYSFFEDEPIPLTLTHSERWYWLKRPLDAVDNVLGQWTPGYGIACSMKCTTAWKYDERDPEKGYRRRQLGLPV